MTPRPLRRLGLWRALAWTYVVVLLAATLLPPPPMLGHVPSGDKIGHVVGFALLQWSFSQIYAGRRDRLRCAAGGFALGILIELLQAAVPYRTAEAADLVADAIGIALGAVLARALGETLSWLDRRWT
jgi:VanZ family protein